MLSQAESGLDGWQLWSGDLHSATSPHTPYHVQSLPRSIVINELLTHVTMPLMRCVPFIELIGNLIPVDQMGTVLLIFSLLKTNYNIVSTSPYLKLANLFFHLLIFYAMPKMFCVQIFERASFWNINCWICNLTYFSLFLHLMSKCSFSDYQATQFFNGFYGHSVNARQFTNYY